MLSVQSFWQWKRGQRVHAWVYRGFVSSCATDSEESALLCHRTMFGLAETD